MEEEINKKKLIGNISTNQGLIGNLNNNSLIGNTQPVMVKSEKDYEKMKNKPQINDVELVKNKTLEDLNVNKLTNIEIENIINSII